jgi:hypothetical protein
MEEQISTRWIWRVHQFFIHGGTNKTRAKSNKMTVTMANKQPSCTESTLVEVNHMDLVFEPEEEDSLFLQ